MPAQMVGERFDLGKFGHVSSLPIKSARARPASRVTNDSSQLTIDSTIAAQIAVHQKSSM